MQRESEDHAEARIDASGEDRQEKADRGPDAARAQDFDTQADHVRLLRACCSRLSPDGLLLFSNNFRKFRLDEAAVAEFASCVEISAKTIDPDFERNPRIHRCWELRRA